MNVILQFLRQWLTKLSLPFWMTAVNVINPLKWNSVRVLAKSFFINMVIKSIDGGTIKDKETNLRRKLTKDEKLEAAKSTLYVLVIAGWVQESIDKADARRLDGMERVVTAEENLERAIIAGVKQLNALRILPHGGNK
jgi:hypothetical protein